MGKPGITEMARRAQKLSDMMDFFGKAWSPGTRAMFLEATADIPNEKFDEGMSSAIMKCKFMPCPAEFRELAVGLPLMQSVADEVAAYQKRWGGKRA